MEGEASPDGSACLSVSPDVLWGVLRSNDELFVSKGYLAAFHLTCSVVSIGPELKVVAEVMVILAEVFQEDVGLALVAIPPLVAELEIGARVGVPGVPALTCNKWWDSY